jgi:hypothetical protein
MHRRAQLLVTLASAITSAAVSAGVLSAAEPADSGAVPASAPGDFRSAAAEHGASATDPDHAGIWKAAVPAGGAMRGEFENHDPIGLAVGVRIPADCSINWVDPDSGKRYCFSSATSLVVFLDAPQAYLARARKSWERLRTAAARTGA